MVNLWSDQNVADRVSKCEDNLVQLEGKMMRDLMRTSSYKGSITHWHLTRSHIHAATFEQQPPVTLEVP